MSNADDKTVLTIWRVFATVGAACLPVVLWVLVQISNLKDGLTKTDKDVTNIQVNMPREIANAIQSSELVRLNEELKRAREELVAARTASEKSALPKEGGKH